MREAKRSRASQSAGRSRRPTPARGHAPAASPVHGLSADNLAVLQRLAGNRAVQELVQRPTSAPAPAPVAVQRKIVTIGTERVNVRSDEEKAEAEAIITRLKDKYGIELNSPATIEGLKAEYPDVKKKVKRKLATKRWRMRELRALEKALAFYAPILGGERAKSTRAGAAQEVTSVGKAKFSIDEDTPAGQLDDETLGEYFETKKNMGLFSPSEGYHTKNYATERKELVATFVHETGHGLLQYALKDFIAASGYWKDEDTKLPRKKRTESPPTTYAHEDAEEDLCDTAAMFFVDRKKLEKKCPKRCAFMVKIGNGWIPAPKAAAKATVGAGAK